MAAPHLTHDIVCIGSHDPREHDFHAANARAVHALFTGGLGPAQVISQCLAGPRVNAAAVSSALGSTVDRGAKNLVVYFSGRSGAAGLHASDDAIDADMLERHIVASRAHAILLILDLAIGAELDQALMPDWLRSLLVARKGVRAAVARATRIGAGVDGEGLARFTAALLAALESAPGDLRFEGAKFISDKLAMEHARTNLTNRWGTADFPLTFGDLGDLPLARSQAAIVGRAAIESLSLGAGLSVAVKWLIESRANMATNLHFALVRPDGTVVGENTTEIVAKNPLQKGKTHVRLPKGVLGRALKTSVPLSSSGMSWRISLNDVRGRALAEEILPIP